MTADVLSMSPTVSADVLANRMRTYGELRVMPIVHRRELVGVVTRSDLLRRREMDNPLARAARKLVGRSDESWELPIAAHRGEGRLAGRDPATLRVRDVMTDDGGDGIVVVYRSTPVVDVAELLVERRFTSVPVVTDDGGLLLGVVSEADMLGGDRPGAARTAGAAMTVDVEVVGPDDPLSAARVLLVERGFRVVPVVDDAGRLVGVLSRSDLL
jgi:CBS domain-containing protein